MRVLHVLDDLKLSGLQKYALALSEWLLERDVEVGLLAGDGPLRGELPRGARFVERRGTSFAAEVRHLHSVVRAERPSVLHAHQRRQALACLVVGRMCGIPVVEHAHNVVDLSRRRLSYRSERVLAVSPSVARMVITEFGREPERVVEVGGVPAHTSELPPPPRPSTENRALRVLGIGRLSAQKDPLRFVRVIAEANRLRPTTARWLGGGELAGEVAALARELHAPVELKGDCDDVVGELDAADGLLLTSAWEGLGLVALEAFGRDRPVVGTAVGGLGDLLAEGRGVAVPPSTSDSELARALVDGLATTPDVARRVAHARAYVTERASADVVFGKILAAYQEVIRG